MRRNRRQAVASTAPRDAASGSAEAPPPLEGNSNAEATDKCARDSPSATPQEGGVPGDIAPTSACNPVAALLSPKEGAEPVLDQPEIARDMDGATSLREGETSQALALGSADTPVEIVEESPGDASMRMAGIDQVILGSDGRSYAVVSVNGHHECHELKAKAFRHLLTRAGLRATGKLPTPDAISAVGGVLEANAEFGGEHADVFLRVARGPSSASYFLDLADRDGRIIEIRADGWEQVARSPVFLHRARGQLALSMPMKGGSVELLKKIVNVEPADWPLFIGWLTAALRPVGPHPTLVLAGEARRGQNDDAQSVPAFDRSQL